MPISAEANLSGTDLSFVKLREAHLIEANLFAATLIRTDLGFADLSESSIGWTIFGAVDLRNVKGLETIQHEEPSTIPTGCATSFNSSAIWLERILLDPPASRRRRYF
jgi:hypothetical protein